MQLNAIRVRPVPAISRTRRNTHPTGTRTIVPDNMDDRVTENIFDVEDEHAEVQLIMRGIDSDAY
jgi:hypothetical protein